METRLALCVADDAHTLYNVSDCELDSPTSRPNTSRPCSRPTGQAPCDDRVTPRWFTSPWNPVRLLVGGVLSILVSSRRR